MSIRNDIEDTFVFPEKQELTVKLKDVLETDVDEKYYLSDEQAASFKASSKLQGKCSGVVGRVEAINGHDILKRIYGTDGCSPTISTMQGGNREPKIVASRGRGEHNIQHLEPRKDDLTNTITSVAKDNYVAEPTPLQRKVCNEAIAKGLVEPNDAIEYTYSNARLKEINGGFIKKQNMKDNNVMSTLKCNPQQIGVCVEAPSVGVAIRTANKQGYDMATDGDGIDLAYPDSKTRRGRVGHRVAKTIPTSDSQGTLDGYRIRKLTPRECWRLMGFDDSDFEKAEKVNSNTQLYKQAGNSIVVNVLEAILGNLIKEK